MGRRRKGQPPQMRRSVSHGYETAYVFIGGKRVPLGPWNSQEARQAYRRIIVEWERDHADVREYRPSGPVVTVADLIAAFMGHAAVYYRNEDGTPTDEVRAFRTSLSPLLDRHGDKAVEDIRPADLKRIRDGWIADGLSRKSINKMLGRIKRTFRWGYAEELVDESTAALLGAVKALSKGRTQAPDHEDVPPAPIYDVFRVFARSMDARQKLITLIQLRTGARPGEVCRMRGDEVSRGEVKIGKRTITLPAGVWAWVPGRHKTKYRGKRVVYMIGPRLQRRIAAAIEEAKGGYLFPGPTGNPISRDGYATRMKQTCQRAGVTPWTPAQLRHNAISRRDRKAGIEAASISVGHASVNTTEIYAERDLGRSAAMAAQWD